MGALGVRLLGCALGRDNAVEAGSLKTSNARTVPLHEHLIAQGFIEFVRAQGDGPLFYNVREAVTAKWTR